MKEGKNPFLLDDLTDKNYQTKYMGFANTKKIQYEELILDL